LRSFVIDVWKIDDASILLKSSHRPSASRRR
jgi:hypothetical protein